MNEKLKFSWANLITFLVLLAFAFYTYYGWTFAHRADVAESVIVALVSVVVLFLLFFGGQQLKATDVKFRKRIVWERIVIFCAPFVLFCAIQPVWHYVNLGLKNKEISASHKKTLELVDAMFDSYDSYADARVNAVPSLVSDSYKGKLDLYVHNKNLQAVLEALIDNKNVDAIKESYKNWKSQGVSVDLKNPSEPSNLANISDYIRTYWYDPLVKISDARLNLVETDDNTFSFDDRGTIIKQIDSQANATLEMCECKSYLSDFSPINWGLLAAVYLLLMFPYWLQDRNTKSSSFITGTMKVKGKDGTLEGSGYDEEALNERQKKIAEEKKKSAKSGIVKEF